MEQHMCDTSSNIRSNRISFLLEIFMTFFRVGAFTFGGGLAMLPLFEREVIENKGWVEKEDILDIYAISQSLPGVIAVNASTFIGYRLAGVPGAVAAITGVMAPSLLVIVAIATVFTQFRQNFYVAKALKGIRAAVAALIFLAAYRIGKASLKGVFGFAVAIGAFMFTLLTDINVIYIILAGGLLGIIVSKMRAGGAR
ncbi:MAG: chromate transporter [Firmicutes bacterium]|nr:chromate transporter [Bacillota bacterium]